MTTVAELHELSHDSPVYALVRRFTGAVSKRTGRPSRWNGVILVDPSPEPETVGLAYPDDGHLTLSGPLIVDRLLQAYAGEPVPDEDLDKLLNAAATVAHEAGHLDDRDGQHADGHPVDDEPAVALDEGLRERWTWDNLDDLLHETGLAERVPGLVGRDTLDEYPAYTAALDKLLTGLEPLTGLRPDELADELRRIDRPQRWNRIAELAVQHELPDLPGNRWAETRRGLADSIRLRFSEAHTIQEDDERTPEQKRTEGGHVGTRTVTLLDAELERISHQLSRNQPALLADRSEPAQTATTATTAGTAGTAGTAATAPGLAVGLAARPAPTGPPGFATGPGDDQPGDDQPGDDQPGATPAARPVNAAELEHLNGFLPSPGPAAGTPGSAARAPGSDPSDGARPGTARVSSSRGRPTSKAGGRG